MKNLQVHISLLELCFAVAQKGKWQMKAERRTPGYTTRIDEILQVK